MVVGHDIDSSIVNISLSNLCHALILLYMLKADAGFCRMCLYDMHRQKMKLLEEHCTGKVS